MSSNSSPHSMCLYLDLILRGTDPVGNNLLLLYLSNVSLLSTVQYYQDPPPPLPGSFQRYLTNDELYSGIVYHCDE
jgi:hypothetical protein